MADRSFCAERVQYGTDSESIFAACSNPDDVRITVDEQRGPADRLNGLGHDSPNASCVTLTSCGRYQAQGSGLVAVPLFCVHLSIVGVLADADAAWILEGVLR